MYKASYKLTNLILSASENFAREYKYTIGQSLKTDSFSIIKNIYHANRSIDKIAHLDEARENLEMIRLQLRLMQDFGQVNLKKFVELNLAIEDVSKQLAAWEKYSKGKNEKK